DRRRAQASRDRGRGALRLLDRDRGGPRLRVRARGDDLAPRGGARLRRSPALGHARPDPLGGSPLPRSRALRSSGVRAARAMTSRGSLARLGLVLALVGVSGAAAAQPPGITRHLLPNGMTVIVRENPAAPVVTASLQVRVGSRFETPETAGITNFLLRAMLRGTSRRSATELAEAAEEIGGSLDASGEVESAEIRGEAPALARRRGRGRRARHAGRRTARSRAAGPAGAGPRGIPRARAQRPGVSRRPRAGRRARRWDGGSTLRRAQGEARARVCARGP